MRILFTTAWYPNRKVAGDGVFIQKHAHAVARLNDVAVLMAQTDEQVKGWNIEIEDKTELVCLANGTKKPMPVALVYLPKIHVEIPLLTGLARLVWLFIGYLKGYHYLQKTYWNGQRPDACHVNVLTRAAMLPLCLKKIHGIPYIITEHWTRYCRKEFPYNKMQLWGTRWAIREASYVCPVSSNLEKAMKGWNMDSPHYTRVGNVVDTETFALRTLDAMDVHDDVARLAHVSWMRDPAKNISGILRVLAELKKRRTDWHLDLIGEGNDKEMLMEYAGELGLTLRDPAVNQGQPLVTFLPALQGQDLAKTLSEHDALLMFSRFENQPVSILEALSCGLPVIATAVGDIPLMLAGKRGIVVKSEDEKELLEVLTAFVDLQHRQKNIASEEEKKKDATLRESRHKYVVEHHSPEVIARQFDVLYTSSLSSAK